MISSLINWESFVSSTWSTTMTSIICPFELAHLNDLLFDEWVNHIVKELNVKEALKSSIFVAQKAAAPKSGVEFRQGANGTIRSSLTTSYDVARRHSIFFDKRNEHTKPHVGAAPHHKNYSIWLNWNGISGALKSWSKLAGWVSLNPINYRGS